MNFTLIPAIISGYAAFHYLTHPTSKLWYRVPSIKLHRRIQIAPSTRLYARGRVIHIHHWFYCALLLAVSIYATGGIIDAIITKGLLIGGILQGFSMPEARKLVYMQKDSWKNFSRDTLRQPFSYPPEKNS